MLDKLKVPIRGKEHKVMKDKREEKKARGEREVKESYQKKRHVNMSPVGRVKSTLLIKGKLAKTSNPREGHVDQ